MRDKFPKSIEHWHTATCADDGRYFKVEQVEVSDMILEWLREVNEELEMYCKWHEVSPERVWPGIEGKSYA